MKRAAIAAVAIAAVAIVAAADAPKKPEPTHFSHASHKSRLDTSKCDTCHGIDDKGQVTPPAALGHSPCMTAACHATWFLATGESGKKKDPKLYAKAAQFCQGCHDSTTGAPPEAWTKPSPGAALRSFQSEREFHVEMKHYFHTQNFIKDGGKDRPVTCRDCHKVDDKTLALITTSPAHEQCVQCHNASNKATHSMRDCGKCHKDTGRKAFYGSLSRPESDVRACGGEGETQFDDKNKGKPHKTSAKVSCFLHERPQHRTRPNGALVQCGDCHAVVAKEEWTGLDKKKRQKTWSYATLKDLHESPIINNNRELQHGPTACGASACHDKDVAGLNTRCGLCHKDLNDDGGGI